MRSRDITISVVSLLLAAVLLVIAEARLDYINSKRYEWNLISNRPVENAPPSLAFTTVAMGAFRGLVVDVLWMRAEKLKQEGQFFDAKQLAEWITTLQPRFPAIWDFQAWNMAYNISVAIPASQPEQRWHWVRNGYELLRDKAIPQNPYEIDLYRSLGWIFLHKIAGISDDVHRYYKLQLALAMEPLVGSQTNEYFQSLAAAPASLDEMLSDPSIAEFVVQLKQADIEFADKSTLPAKYLSLRQNPRGFNPEALETIDRYRGTETLAKFDIFARGWQLRNEWKMDPVLMQELNQTYGPLNWDDPNTHEPLNWQHPAAHALYWAARGLQVASEEGFHIEELQTDRIVYQSMHNLLRTGKLTIYSVRSASTGSDNPGEEGGAGGAGEYSVFLRPDLRMFWPCDEVYRAVIKKNEELGPEAEWRAESLKNAHRHMLLNAVALIYQSGHISQARKVYNQLRDLYPREEFNVPLTVFVRKRVREELSVLGIKNVTETVIMLLREAYFRYAIGDDDDAFGREKMAEELYQAHMKETEETPRIQLPQSFATLRYLALFDFLNDRSFPRQLRERLKNRIKVERPELSEQLEEREAEMLEAAGKSSE